MITYEEALNKAKELKPPIDTCSETEDAFVFSNSKTNDVFGGDQPCVILKESGKAINYLHFVLNYKSEELRRIVI